MSELLNQTITNRFDSDTSNTNRTLSTKIMLKYQLLKLLMVIINLDIMPEMVLYLTQR